MASNRALFQWTIKAGIQCPITRFKSIVVLSQHWGAVFVDEKWCLSSAVYQNVQIVIFGRFKSQRIGNFQSFWISKSSFKFNNAGSRLPVDCRAKKFAVLKGAKIETFSFGFSNGLSNCSADFLYFLKSSELDLIWLGLAGYLRHPQ